jgi:RHS repeat-associated protein
MTTDPLFMKIGADYYYYHNDHIGTPRKMTSVSGAVVWSAKYSSFGEAAVDASSTIANPLRFPGQYEDAETGLHYNWHRYYDSNRGNYISKDFIGIVPFDIYDDVNHLYNYSKSNPLIFFDPLGLTPADRVRWALNQYKTNPEPWAREKRLFRNDYWKCNEFVYYTHTHGDPDIYDFPTVYRENTNFYKPVVSDYADPCFAKDRLDYMSISQVQPGDIIVWHDSTRGVHHSAIAINTNEVIYAGTDGLKKNTISNVSRSFSTTPIVRRYKY